MAHFFKKQSTNVPNIEITSLNLGIGIFHSGLFIQLVDRTRRGIGCHFQH